MYELVMRKRCYEVYQIREEKVNKDINTEMYGIKRKGVLKAVR